MLHSPIHDIHSLSPRSNNMGHDSIHGDLAAKLGVMAHYNSFDGAMQTVKNMYYIIESPLGKQVHTHSLVLTHILFDS